MAVFGLNDIIKLQVDWHPVFWGFSLQFIFALITLKTQWKIGVAKNRFN
jgi:hypothetical protein